MQYFENMKMLEHNGDVGAPELASGNGEERVSSAVTM
jgi:hypothetical protein